MSDKIVEARLERAVAAMNEFDIDLWVTYGRETHFTSEPVLNYLIPCDVLFPIAIVVTKAGQSICIVESLNADELITHGSFTQVVNYSDYNAFDETLLNVIKEHMINPSCKVALNTSVSDSSADGLSHTGWLRLTRLFEEAGFKGEYVSSYMIMKRMRAQKSQAEIDKIAAAVEKGVQILDEARSHIKVGLNGPEIQAFFQKKSAELAAPSLYSPFCSIGPRSSYLCKRPAVDVYVQPGDVVNVDYGVIVDGFASDNQRTYYILKEGETEAPEYVRNAVKCLQEANKAAAAIMKPGVYTTDLRDAANAVIRSYGFPEVPSLGHELGIFAHEGGMRAGSDFRAPELDNHIEEGMVFTFEPAILLDIGRVCQEEVVVCTKDGGKFLSRFQDGPWLIKG